MLKNTFSRRTALATLALGLLASSPVLAQSPVQTYDVVLFSYLNQPLLDVTLNGLSVGTAGSYPYSGRRTKVGAKITEGNQVITWRTSGTTFRAANTPSIDAFPNRGRYIAVHIYPDGKVELAFSERFPTLSPRGKAFDLEWRARKGQ